MPGIVVTTGGGGSSSPATTTSQGSVLLADINASTSDNTKVPTYDVVNLRIAQEVSKVPTTNGVTQVNANYLISAADHKSLLIVNVGSTITIPSGLDPTFECTILKNTSADVVLSTTLTTIVRPYGYTGNKVVSMLTVKMIDSNTVAYLGGTTA